MQVNNSSTVQHMEQTKAANQEPAKEGRKEGERNSARGEGQKDNAILIAASLGLAKL